MTDHNPTLEEKATQAYVDYWETMDNPYATRWEMLGECLEKKEYGDTYALIRQACVEMYKQGFIFKITGE